MAHESFEIAEPDIEIIVRSGEHELAVMGLFQNKRGVWDMVLGIDDTSRIDQLITLMDFISASLPVASFRTVRSAGDFYGDERSVDVTDRPVD